MFYLRVGGLRKGCCSLSVVGLSCLLKRRPVILRGMPWTLSLYVLRRWRTFGMVV